MMIQGKRSSRKSKFRVARKAHDLNQNPIPTGEHDRTLTTISVDFRVSVLMVQPGKIEMVVITSREASFSASV